jgi:hypothetical protein
VELVRAAREARRRRAAAGQAPSKETPAALDVHRKWDEGDEEQLFGSLRFLRLLCDELMAAKKSRWSSRVTRESNALDLENHVFAKKDPKAIARSLKRSAEESHRRKSNPYRSAMSMLTFYINRAGKNLSKKDRSKLERAKDELRRLYGKDA